MQDAISKITAPYCICVIPLLTESNGIHFIDRILVVDSSIANQIMRAKKRDGTTAESIQKIVNSQVDRQARLKIADDVLENNGKISEIEKKIVRLHHQYLTLAQQT